MNEMCTFGRWIRRILVGLAAALVAVPAAAQPDTLAYRSPLEAQTLEAWTGAPDDAGLVRAILAAEGADAASLDGYERKLNDLYEGAAQAVNPRHAVARRAKALFKYLHGRVLHKYVEEATLRGTLDEGTYNCVSATVLFYLLSRRHDVPVELWITPVHLYAVVPDGGRRIHVETTDPKDGFDFDAGVDETVRMLLRYKRVTPEELREKGAAALYREFAEGSEVLAPAHLLGVTYGNLAVFQMAEGDYRTAFHTYEKAIAVDTARVAYREGYVFSLHLVAAESERTPEQFYPLLHRALRRLPTYEALRETAFEYLYAEATYYARQQRDFEKAHAVVREGYAFYAGDTTQVARLQGVEEELDWNWAASLAATGHHEAAFEKMRRVQARRPDDPKAREDFVHIARQYTSRLVQRGENERALVLTDSLLAAFPTYPILRTLYAELTHYTVVHDNLLRDRPEHALDLLMKAHEVDGEHVVVRRLVAAAYYEMGMAKIRAHAYREAHDLVTRGLAFDPDNAELHETIAEIEELWR